MESKPQTTLFSWSTLLPVALIASLVIILVLIINSRNYDELKKQNEAESERRISIKNEIQTLESKIELLKPEAASLKTTVASLNEQKGAANETINQARALTGNYNELKKQNEAELERRISFKNEIQTLESRIELLKPEAASLKTTISSLNEQKGAANETINQARALTLKVEQLRTEESNLKQRIQDQEKSYQEVLGKMAMAQRNLADSETKIREARVELNTVQAKQNDSAERVKSLTQTILEREGSLSAKNTEVAAKSTEIAGKNAEVAAKSAMHDGILAESKIVAKRLADSKSELDGLTKEIGRMNKERADLIELARIRSEKSDLAAKVDGLKQDQRSLEGQIEDRKQEKVRLERELAELHRAKNALLTKPASAATEQNKTTPSK